MSRRKVAVITGTRADYGLLYWLMRDIQHDVELGLQLIVTGMHLSPEFGLTYRTIEEDGFSIDAKIEMLLSGDTPTAITKSIGLGTIGFADAFARLQPDVIVILGDRFEMLSAAQAAMVARIPIAHIHGGESSEGAIDEAIRHAITKMAHLHFVAAAEYRRRVIQLGEQPERVFTVGAPGLDYLNRLQLLSRSELEQELGFSLGERCFLVTYHPVTLSDRPLTEALQELLSALDEYPDARLIITYPNADTFGRALINQIESYASERPDRVLVSPSLGQLRYLSALQYVDAVVGNSSSGLIEAPSFQTPTVNIGPRQQGRLRAASVIDCKERREDIKAAIDRALDPGFRATLTSVSNPYGDGHATRKIIEQLQNSELDELGMKIFYDLPVNA